MLYLQLVFLAITSCVASPITPYDLYNGLPYYKKSDWGGRPATDATTELATPVPYVVIHHSYIPEACFTVQACKAAMRSMQDMHQLTNGWIDIGYNFAVGSDGAIYEGRGWETVGAHAAPYNSLSIGILLIGDWRFETPPKAQINSAKQLIQIGVESGYIRKEYELVGHGQISNTECPGNALLQEISEWDHYYNGQLV